MDEAHSRELARAQAAAGYTLGSGMENPEVEAPLVARLLARGCDPNVLERRGGIAPCCSWRGHRCART
ncbi:hypothetical protein COCCU_04995 [Corynebacterium occultum]|uniref:Ankyrin repeat domain-containing protein n=1 Tax=Corynebacterium occultum TaxID=2675219 RepID=A0A6B8W6J8_9CORY|nr:hypothetical protein COCCU_04995 [Corynebacterium occultum]